MGQADPLGRRILRQLPFVLFTLISSLFLLEIGARFLLPAWQPVSGDRNFWQYDDTLGWTHVPNAAARFDHLDFSIDVQTNSHGHRDDEVAFERKDSQQRALLLGDSFGWGFGVEKDEIFSERIEARQDDWEIINASVSGYGTDQEYLYYLTEGHRFDSDLVILLYYENDIDNAAHPVQYWHNKPVFQRESGEWVLNNVPVPPRTTAQAVANWVANHTWFFRGVSHAGAAWLASLRTDGEADISSEMVNSELSPNLHSAVRLSEGEGRILAILERLNSEVQADGAQLVIVAAPGKSRKLFEHSDFQSLKIPYLSLTGIFQDSDEPAFFQHDAHWNPNGHAIVADAVESFLIQEGLMAASGSEDASP